MMYCIGGKKILYRFIEPEHKIMVLTGLSGSGKTQLYNLISKRFTEKKGIEYYCIDDNGYKTVPKLNIKTIDMVLSNFGVGSNVDDTIIVVDETSTFIKSSTAYEIAKFVNDERNATNYFIFVLRELSILSGLSVHVGEIYNILTIREHKVNDIVRTFPNYLYEGYYSIPVIKNILCEDSKSSFFFFKEYFGYTPNVNLFTSGGKDNIIKSFKDLMRNNLDNLLIVIDSCAFGLKIQKLKDMIDFDYSGKNIYILDWDCYEQYLLESSNIVDNLKENIAILEYPIYLEEVQYYNILRAHLLNYSKGGEHLPVCLDLSKRCVSNQCNYFNSCTCKVDHVYNFDRMGVYIHEPLTDRFVFQPDTNVSNKEKSEPSTEVVTALYFGNKEPGIAADTNKDVDKGTSSTNNKSDETDEQGNISDNQYT